MSATLFRIVAIISCTLDFSIGVDWQAFRQNPVSLSVNNFKLKIINGGEVEPPHLYPFQAAVLINGNALCGGTLISQSYILTAAHCATVIRQRVEVILGAHNLLSNETTQVHIKVANVTIHEKFNNRNYQNDLALLKLSTPVTLNNVIKTVTLPKRADAGRTLLGVTATSIGWGIQHDVPDPSIDDISATLRAVNLTIMNLSDCADEYVAGAVTDINICTSGYKNKGTCYGDSGGPLMYGGVQIGVVSAGDPVCEECAPSVYTKVSKFLDWIEDHSDVVIS